VMLHHVVKVDSGASLSLLESGPAGARSNFVLETDIGAAGSFRHVRVQGRDQQRLAATHHFARLHQESIFKSFTLTANGALTRNEDAKVVRSLKKCSEMARPAFFRARF
jgi:Fe-S cluster assembly protein SufD